MLEVIILIAGFVFLLRAWDYYLLAHSTCGMIFDCNYIDFSWDSLLNLYTCKGFTIESVCRTVLPSVKGEHKSGKGNFDAKFLYITDKIVYTLSKAIDKFFTNLKGFYISNSQVETISDDDLQSFPNLWNFSLSKMF